MAIDVQLLKNQSLNGLEDPQKSANCGVREKLQRELTERWRDPIWGLGQTE